MRGRIGFLCVAGAILAAGCSIVTDLDGFTNGPLDGGAADANDAVVVEPDAGSPPPSVDAGEDASVAESAYANAVLADRPLAYLRLGETEGETARDRTGGGNDGLVSGTFRWAVAGALANDRDTALRTEAAAIDLGSRFDFKGTDPFSLEAWFHADAIDTEFRHIFSKAVTDANGRESYYVYLYDGAIAFERRVDDAPQIASAPATDLPGRWVHLVATYDGAKLSLYVDGALAGETADPRAQPAKDTPFLAATKEKFQGSFVGAIDEIAIYDHALAPDRVKAHFDAAH